MKIDGASSPAHPRVWLGILGVGIALSTPVVQVLLIPCLESTFSFPIDRLVSLGVFWIALILALSIAHFAEGYPLAAFGFQRSQKTLRARLLEKCFFGAKLGCVRCFELEGTLGKPRRG